MATPAKGDRRERFRHDEEPEAKPEPKPAPVKQPKQSTRKK